MSKLLNFPVRLRKAYEIARETKVMRARTDAGPAVRGSLCVQGGYKKRI